MANSIKFVLRMINAMYKIMQILEIGPLVKNNEVQNRKVSINAKSIITQGLIYKTRLIRPNGNAHHLKFPYLSVKYNMKAVSATVT